MVTRRLKLSEAIEVYVAHCTARQLASGTIRGHQSSLGLFLRVTGDLQLDSITGAHVERVFMHYQWAPTTRNTKIGQFRAFFRWARGSRHMNPMSDPMLGWRQRTPPEKSHLRIPFAEWPRLFNACVHPQERIVVATGLYLFLRASEQQALKIGCVDLQSNLIQIWRPKISKWQTMPIASELDVEMRSWLTYLSERYELHDDHHLICSRNKDMAHDPVTKLWVAGSGTMNLHRPVHKPALIVQRVLRRAGYVVEKGQGEHTLRRSGARALFDSLVAQGYDGALKQVQRLLGHKHSYMTEVYLGIDLEQHRVLQAFAGKPMFPHVQDVSVIPIREVPRG